MLICPKCQNEVKYIVSKDNEVLVVNPAVDYIVTDTGRKVAGYKLHECHKKEKE